MGPLKPQIVILVYWAMILPMAAFFLRQACSLVGANLPSWKRSFISVALVTFLAYLTFDYTCYLIMRSLDGVALYVPPWYGYSIWYREPLALKWQIVSFAGPLKYLPIVFALCAAGIFQVLVLEAEVTFMWGFGIVAMQTIATCIAGYILTLVFGSVIRSAGLTFEGEPVAVAAAKQQQAPAQQSAAAQARSNRYGSRKSPSKKARPEAQPETGNASAEATSLQLVKDKAGEAATASGEYAKSATENLKRYGDELIEQLDEDLAPITNHLPEPAQNFLAKGGWWVILAGCGVIILLWIRSLAHRLGGKVKKVRKKGKKKKRRNVGVESLKENLTWVGKGVTELGPQQISVKGNPARLRLVILSMGNRSGGDLNAEMSDQVLDWIKSGMSHVASYDQPGVRIWPDFYSTDGFTTSLSNLVTIPEPPGMKSHWVLVGGRVKMGRVAIQVGLALYCDDPNSLRLVKVRGERWEDALSMVPTPELARYR